LLFYNGRYNEKHDFIALELIAGQVQFSFSLGTTITRVIASVEGGVSDGKWRQVTIDYHNRVCICTKSKMYFIMKLDYAQKGFANQFAKDILLGLRLPLLVFKGLPKAIMVLLCNVFFLIFFIAPSSLF